jgi:hypothetical protein
MDKKTWTVLPCEGQPRHVIGTHLTVTALQCIFVYDGELLVGAFPCANVRGVWLDEPKPKP